MTEVSERTGWNGGKLVVERPRQTVPLPADPSGNLTTVGTIIFRSFYDFNEDYFSFAGLVSSLRSSAAIASAIDCASWAAEPPAFSLRY